MGRTYFVRFTTAVILLRQVAAALQVDADFSNNLISDLAPLLALFGEQVAKQFMSQSMGWADHIIFAMVPLGILTAVVGAIRVGGPNWLRAIIGRARENRCIAEVELMSSTSHEVCELWNGQQIVRIMGSPPIKEILWVSGSSADGFNSRDLMVEKENLVKTSGLLPKFLRDINIYLQQVMKVYDVENQTPEGGLKKAKESAPNISLNLHNRAGRTELYTVAIIAVVIQFGILVYGGFITYHPQLKYEKGEPPVEDYFFPILVVGTIILGVGLFICAHVIESSTKEEQYKSSQPGVKVHALWLQKAGTVADQSFNSFAIFAKDDRKVITTSRRKSGWDDETEKSDVQRTTRLFTTVGTIITLCGFFLQFTGLRGMHWSVTLVQLGGTLVMATLRAYVRRDLTEQPRIQQLPRGYELEWLATRYSKLDHYWPKSTSKVREDDLHTHSTEFWSKDFLKIPSDESLDKLKETRVRLGALTGWQSPASNEAQWVATAIEIVLNTLFPSNLEDKLSWSLKIRTLGNNETNLGAKKVAGEKWKTNTNEIEAILSLWLYATKRKYATKGGNAPKGENAISGDDAADGEEKPLEPTEPPNESSLEDGNSKQKPSRDQSIRLLGSDTVSLRRDLGWWVDGTAVRVLAAKEVYDKKKSGNEETVNGENTDKYETIFIDRDRIVGGEDTKNPTSEVEFMIREEPFSVQKDGPKPLLVALSDAPLPLLFAQEIFTAFMGAVAKKLTEPIAGGTKVHHTNNTNVSDALSWQSFTLQNPTLSKMAQEVQRTGLGTLEEVYLSIIPPLSTQEYLPDAGAVIELAREQAENHELRNHWKKSAEIYQWLFRTCKSSSPPDYISQKATAVLVDFFRLVIMEEKVSADQAPEGAMTKELRDVRSKLREEIEKFDKELSGMGSPNQREETKKTDKELKDLESNQREEIKKSNEDILSEIMRLYNAQNRTTGDSRLEPGDWEPLKVNTGGVDRIPINSLGISPLHYQFIIDIDRLVNELIETDAKKRESTKGHQSASQQTTTGGKERTRAGANDQKPITSRKDARKLIKTGGNVKDLIRASANVNGRDWFDWTPLHYIANHRKFSEEYHFGGVKILLEAGADVNPRDLVGWTPLHYCCWAKNPIVFRSLLQDGAEVEVRGRDGKTPLHCAAMSGDEESAKLLIEAGANTEAPDASRNTPLHWAAYRGHKDVAAVLLKAGDVRVRNNDGRTPGHLAALAGKTDVLRLFLENKVDANIKDRVGCTTLHLAAAGGSRETVQYLLGQPSVDKKARDNDKLLPLHWAAKNGMVGTISVLLGQEDGKAKGEQEGKGEDKDKEEREGVGAVKGDGKGGKIEDEEGAREEKEKEKDDGRDEEAEEGGRSEGMREVEGEKSEEGGERESKGKGKEKVEDKEEEAVKTQLTRALHLAVMNDKSEMVQFLLDRGIDIEATDDDSMTPLLLAAKYGCKTVMDFLLTRGANKEAKNEKKRAIHFAAEEGKVDMIDFLLKQGFDKEAREDKGKTALHTAIYQGHEAVVRFLLGKEVEKEAADWNGFRALHYAATIGREAIAEILLDEKVDINAKSKDEMTSLHLAARAGHLALVRLLLDRGAEIEAKGDGGKTALHKAAKYGHEPVVRLLLDHGAEIEAKDDGGETALHKATKNGHEPVVRLLLHRKAEINAKNNNGRAALPYAYLPSVNEQAVVQLLLDRGLDKNARNDVGETVLHFAAGSGNESMARLLLDHGVETDVKDSEGLTALHQIACTPLDRWSQRASDYKAVAQLLLDRGFDKNAKNNNGETVLHFAARAGNESMVRLLLDHGAEIEAKDDSGSTALHHAASNGSEPVVQLLLDHGAQIEAKHDSGSTALHLATSAGSGPVVQLLLDHGAEIEAKDNKGKRALHNAASTGSIQIVQLLLNRGAEIEAKDDSGSTALHHATSNCRKPVIQLLLDRSAEKDAKDNKGWTALHHAAKSQKYISKYNTLRWSEVIQLLLDQGLDANAKNDDGETALHVVASNGYIPIVQLLLDHGAEKDSKDNKGWTALHHAASTAGRYYQKRNAVVKFLLDQGLDKNAKSDDGKTPLDLAKEIQWKEAVKILEATDIDQVSDGDEFSDSDDSSDIDF